MMTHRERWMRTLRHESVDRGIDVEFATWDQTVLRWRQEGAPIHEGESAWAILPRLFDTDESHFGPALWFNNGLLPAFEYKVLEIKGDQQIVQDGDGALCEMMRPELGASIPRYLRHAIETRADWEKFRDERLNPEAPGRLPDDLDERCRLSRTSDGPVFTGGGSLYGWLRNWMGVENLSYAVYDDPAWVEEMMEHLTRLTLHVMARLAAAGAKVDMSSWWEDMCYNHGPLLSPDRFHQWMVPRYKRVTDFMRRELGCEWNFLDCDGYIHDLVPLWLEGGINGMWPLEVAGNTDPYWIRKTFGRRFVLRGGYDKRALIAGPAAIDAEFERLRPLYRDGGFIPHTDHLVPPDVSWQNYLHYRRRKCAFLGRDCVMP